MYLSTSILLTLAASAAAHITTITTKTTSITKKLTTITNVVIQTSTTLCPAAAMAFCCVSAVGPQPTLPDYRRNTSSLHLHIPNIFKLESCSALEIYANGKTFCHK